jgi:hypothetical protein
MLLRNKIEIAVLIFLLVLILIIYLRTKRKVDDIESDIQIRPKSEIKEKLEEVDEIDKK